MCVYANSFKEAVYLAPEFIICHKSHGIDLGAASNLDSEDVQRKIEAFLTYMRYCRMNPGILRLLFNPHVFSAIILLRSSTLARYTLKAFFGLNGTHTLHTPYSPNGQSNTLMRTLVSSYARVMDHLYGALECFIKTQMYLYEMRTTGSATLLEDLPSAIKPLMDLHEDTFRLLELAGSEANTPETLIQEVGALRTSSLLHHKLTKYSSWKLPPLSTL